jgi:hypothetical protein
MAAMDKEFLPGPMRMEIKTTEDYIICHRGATAPLPPDDKAVMPLNLATFQTICAGMNAEWARMGAHVVCKAKPDGGVIFFDTAVSNLDWKCNNTMQAWSEITAPGPITIEVKTADDDVICHR